MKEDKIHDIIADYIRRVYMGEDGSIDNLKDAGKKGTNFYDARRFLNVNRVSKEKIKRAISRPDGNGMRRIYGLPPFTEKNRNLTLSLLLECQYFEWNKTSLSERLSADSLRNRIWDYSGVGGEERFDLDTVREAMTDMKTAGYFRSDKKGSLVSSNQTAKCLESLSDAELVRLYLYVVFYSEIGYPRVAGYFLQDSLSRYLESRGLDIPENPFSYRDNTYQGILEEILVSRLAEFCGGDRLLALTTQNGKGEETHIVYPVKMKVENQQGRWYLVSVSDGEDNNVYPTRVSNIKRILGINSEGNGELLARLKAKAERLRDTVNSHTVSKPYSDNLITVEAEIRFPNDGKREMRMEQLRRSMTVGEISEDETRCIFHVGDATELKPFFRSYINYLRVLPGEGHHLDTELPEEYRRMLAQYEQEG